MYYCDNMSIPCVSLYYDVILILYNGFIIAVINLYVLLHYAFIIFMHV